MREAMGPRRQRLTAILGAVLVISACGGGGGGGGGGPAAPQFDSAPQVMPGPNPAVPLARVLTTTTDVPTRLEITATDGAGHTVTGGNAAVSSITHAEPLIGLKPGRTYDVTVTAIAPDGTSSTWDQPLQTTTDPLPENFPVLQVLTAQRDQMEPGFTLFGTRNKDVSATYLVIVDDQGDVVWFMATPTTAVVEQLANGNLIFISGDRFVVREINFLGETVRSWFASFSTVTPPAGSIPVATHTFHHEILPIENEQSFLTTSDDIRTIENFPVDENDETVRAAVPVLDQPVVEYAADGTVLRRWNFLDLINPTRIGFDATQGLPAAADWAHSNAVILDPRDNTIIASLRHQDALVKASRTDLSLEWILGPHDNWEGFEQFLLTPVGEPFAWPYHQHAPQITNRGTLLLFDNGTFRASPFTGQPKLPAPENFSRAVEYEIDEDAKTIRQVWEFVDPERMYAPFVGSAFELRQTGNVLITYGGLCTVDGQHSDDILNCRGSARFIEVHRGAPDTVVFDLSLADRDPAAIGWLVYRGQRIPSLGR